MIDTNWHVITGGPCSGKTGIIENLASIGYQIVLEAARIYIDEEISKGRTLEQIRGNEAEFQRIVLEMKIDIENNLPAGKLIFLERGIPDSIAYNKICGGDVQSAIDASKIRRYKKVFLLEQLPYKKDYARTEDEQTAKKISKLLYDSYTSLGYDVIVVPATDTLEERIKIILGHVL